MEISKEGAPGALESIDTKILEGVRRSDPEALGAFFDHYFDRIYGLAYRLLGNRSMAEDATQEICYRIQRGAPRLDTTRDPTPWVMTTTVNTCRSLWRSSPSRMDRASHPIDDSPAMEMASDPLQSPDGILGAEDRRRSVIEAVQDLEESLREVVVLHDYEGLDHKEIASVLGLSHDAVRKRYSRALATLAQRLKGIVG